MFLIPGPILYREQLSMHQSWFFHIVLKTHFCQPDLLVISSGASVFLLRAFRSHYEPLQTLKAAKLDCKSLAVLSPSALSRRISEHFRWLTTKIIRFAFHPISMFLSAINRALCVIFLTLNLGLSAKSRDSGDVVLCQLT